MLTYGSLESFVVALASLVYTMMFL